MGEVKKAMARVKWDKENKKLGRHEVLVRWTKPRDGWVKLNTDGAVKGNPGSTSGGGLI